MRAHSHLNTSRYANGFSLIETIVALALSGLALMTVAVAIPFGREQLRVLQQQQAAEVFVRNVAQYIRANPESDYRWQNRAAGSTTDCTRSLCDPSTLALFELNRARLYLNNSITAAEFYIEKKDGLYVLSLGFPDKLPFLSVRIRP